MDKLRSMEIFVAVVDAGSFTAAADAFNISAVMVGKHIKHLEARLGARLLTRTTRRQGLTEIGRQYCEQCRLILAQIAAAETGAEAMHSGPRGTLRLSVPVTFGTEWLAPAMTHYLAQYPEVSLDLNLNDRLADLVDEGFDAAVRIGALPDSSMIARPLRPFGMVICAAPDYLARRGTPRTPADLARHECLAYMYWNKTVGWRLKGETETSAQWGGRFNSNNGQALRMAALQGFGIVMQSEILLAQDIAAGRLVSLLEEFVPAPRPMHLLYPRDRQPTPKLTTVVDFILQRFGAAAPWPYGNIL